MIFFKLLNEIYCLFYSMQITLEKTKNNKITVFENKNKKFKQGYGVSFIFFLKKLQFFCIKQSFSIEKKI